MASKSKRRRRVLGASCILAALIVAGSSFAWFTSKDEVTNRLSASADYNVSIIENFAPPKQWTPGQTVKKEEAVVNTGNVDAFVKQTITADLKVAIEVPTKVAPDKATAADLANYLKLEDQVDWGTLEAGSVLAWKPEADTTNQLGTIIGMGIDGDNTTEFGTKEFDPVATGLYVFRRAITKTDTDEQHNAEYNKDKSYDYVGYYYYNGNYYKLFALNVDGCLDTQTDGLLKKEPVVSYSKKIITNKKNVDMFFVEDSSSGETDYKLKVVYKSGEALDEAITDSAKQADAQAVYTNYQEYLDYLEGKTTYVPATGTGGADWTYPGTENKRENDLRALAEGNKTGLIDYDIYNQDAQTAVNGTLDTRETTLEDFSYKRLEDLKYGNNYDKANYDTWQTAGKRTGAKKDNSDIGSSESIGATGAPYGLEGMYNFYSPVMGAYNNKEYGAFTPFDGTASDTTKVTHNAVDSIDAAWTAAQNEADRSRQIINTGVNAAAALQNYKTYVETAIGRATSDAENSGVYEDGLRLVRTAGGADDPVGTNRWEANQLYQVINDPTNGHVVSAEPNIEFKLAAGSGDGETDYIEFDQISDGDTGPALTRTMTVDNFREDRFKDNETGFKNNGNGASNTGTAGSQVWFKDIDTPFGTVGANSTLKSKWDEYVIAKERKMLVEKKIELVQAAIDSGTGIRPANGYQTQTNAARDMEEAKKALAELKADKELIDANFNAKQKAYNDEVAKLRNYIQKMNELQTMVDAANKEYNEYIKSSSYSDYSYLDSEANSARDNIVTNVISGGASGHGQADSPVEDILEDCLKKAYGVAHMADAPAVFYNDDYPIDTTTHTQSTDTTPRKTYSKATTENDVKSLTVPDNTTLGTTKFDLTSANFDTSAFKDDGTDAGTVSTAVKAAPYYRLLEVDNMMAKRKAQYEDEYKEYQAAADVVAMYTPTAGNGSQSRDITIYIDLANVTEDATATANDKWQYIGDATATKTADHFDFGYTSILGSGKTSKLLVESVYFDSAVKQDAFIDVVFDINVGAESAQVVYNGSRAYATAARESLNPIIPSAEDYINSDAVVDWNKRTTDVTAPITEKDPKPKAETNVNP